MVLSPFLSLKSTKIYPLVRIYEKERKKATCGLSDGFVSLTLLEVALHNPVLREPWGGTWLV